MAATGLGVVSLVMLRLMAPQAAMQAGAEDVLAAAKVPGGLVVHLGCGTGELTAALRAGDGYLVHGLDRDAPKIDRAREAIRKLGLYGPVSVERWASGRLPYADNLVNLLVVSDAGAVTRDEMMRVLVPRGVLLVRDGAAWVRTEKPCPATIDEWTHYLHGPDGNPTARDTVVGPPAQAQWIGGPLWARHHEFNTSVHALVSARGRIFYVCDEAPATVAGLPDQWKLIARDAFSGVVLWKRPIAEWGWRAWSLREPGGRFNLPIHVARRLVAAGERVYVTLGFNAPLTALDAATGKVLKTYEATENTDEVLYQSGVLILSVNKGGQGPGQISERAPVKKQVLALKAETGEVLWRRGDYTGVASKADAFERITHLSLTAGDTYVCLVEEGEVVCLDLKDGQVRWRAPRPAKAAERGHVPYNPPNLCTLVACGEVVLLAQPEEPYTRRTWTRGVKVLLTGLSARTGERLWAQPCAKWGPGVEADVFVVGGLVWTHAAEATALVGIDPATGEVKRSFSTEEAFGREHHHRCYRNKATDRYVLTARRGIELLDLKAERCDVNDWLRGSCRHGIVPCNGLIYVPPHPCQCYITVKINGFWALAPKAASSPAADAAGDRIEKGPAFAAAAAVAVGAAPDEWPTYRHDVRRSGSTQAEVPAELRVIWRAKLGGKLSACTVAGGTVFAACIDEHRVVALEAKEGKPLWSHTAGGRVDTPPTIHGGRALFGSADGWVYCLRASDGALAWRLRAAVRERRITASGQIESAWPVHGTVLVADGVGYAAAGRSTYLDGGIRAFSFRPETGEVVDGFAVKPGLADVLVSDGKSVYMRSQRLGAPAPSADEPAPQKKRGKRARAPATRLLATGGLLDDTCFSRVGWTAPGAAGKADLLVFDDQSAYAFGTKRTGGFGGWFYPGTGAYKLTASGPKGARKPRWSIAVPIRVRAMVAAGERLFVAGPPDVAEPSDPPAAFEGRTGAVLRVLSTADGSTLAEHRLDAPPVWDGLAAAGRRLYVSCLDGTVLCLGGP